MVVICTSCGIEFDKPDHRVKRNKSGKHYCSKDCYKKNPIITQRSTGKDVECKECGLVFYRSQATLEKSKSGDWFCSRKCRASYYSEAIQSNHNSKCLNCGSTFHSPPSLVGKRLYCSRECWKKYIRSSGPSYYRSFKKEVCEVCGFIPIDPCQLDIHHKDGYKKNNKEENLMTVCANCHRLLHKKPNT